MYKVQFMSNSSASWTNNGGYGSEQSAIFTARSVLKRVNVKTVRMLDPSGNVVFIESN